MESAQSVTEIGLEDRLVLEELKSDYFLKLRPSIWSVLPRYWVILKIFSRCDERS